MLEANNEMRTSTESFFAFFIELMAQIDKFCPRPKPVRAKRLGSLNMSKPQKVDQTSQMMIPNSKSEVVPGMGNRSAMFGRGKSMPN